MPRKPKLKYNTETFFTVDHNDWDEFVNKCYNVGVYEICPMEELSNGQMMRIIAKKEVIDSYNQKKIDKITSNEYVGFCTQVIAVDLCNKGYLKPGEYMIEIYW